MKYVRRLKYFRMVSLAVLAGTATVLAAIYVQALAGADLRVCFLDVGQGDSIYVSTPSGRDMLIDGGQSIGVLRRLAEEMSSTDRSIDVVLATHPDADHIGGLPPVLERYEIGMFIEPGVESENSIDNEMRRIVKERDIEAVAARRGMRVDFGDGAVFDILAPDDDAANTDDTNASSIVGRLRYGKTAFMLTGDAPRIVEDRIVAADTVAGLQSQVLKAGHHGSKTSSGESFVRAVAPRYAVISAGKDNRYGHPSKEVTDLFARLAIDFMSTYEDGTVCFISDGKDVYGPRE